MIASKLQVRYSNGGITCTLGHPYTIYEPLAMGIFIGTELKKRKDEIRDSRLAENDAYWFFDNIKDVDNKWNNLLKTKPDVIKIMLLFSNRYDSLHKNKNKLGGKGLSPEVAKYVVKKAKANNLRVFAHIETAFDFKVAVNIGVNVVAHLPGYSWNGDFETLRNYTLSNQDLLKAKENNLSIITTASISKKFANIRVDNQLQFSQERFSNIIKHQKKLIERFINYDINLSIGSDVYGKTLFEEVNYLHKYKMLNNLQIINNMSSM
ncbi:hypothetical protein [Polaribacter porphyrae]|uniref:Amidohydrolase-related domain-containing protein n=1 Tax=Polaribacter porphyrae TaxID=1137780 RepID=A0A2S7WNV1_9FLAO|nr:hypothetical protein [Polaribacter porphyrae]PQJ79279.1 hypothetical protein BTO18_08880 [Polaribacter porphyrae]